MKISLLSLGGLLLAVGVATLWIGLRFDGLIRTEVRRLIAGAVPQAVIVSEAMLAPLPEPARRYLLFSGVVGTRIPSVVTVLQRGRIRSGPDATWTAFEAVETYSTSPVAFVWRAWFPRRLLPVVFGRDKYLDGEGAITMKGMGVFPVADESGPELRPAGLMRYLNEMMWFPAALLGDNVRISSSGVADAFNVAITDRGETASATIFVGRDGSIQNFRAERYDTSTRAMGVWETPINGHGMRAGLHLPVAGSALWKRPAGDFTYIEIAVDAITYD